MKPHARGQLGSALVVVGVALAYFATGRAILVLGAPPNGAVTTVWLPSGITVAALVLFGPWAALGSFVGSIALDLKMSTPLPAALIVGIANAGSEFLCYYLIAGRYGRAFSVIAMRDVLRFMMAAVLGSALSALVGVGAYAVFGVIPAAIYWPVLLTWFGSTAIGIVLITPFLVYALRDRPALGSCARYVEFVAALAALAIAAFLWQGPAFTRNADEPVILIAILGLLWIAFRFPPAAMTLAVFSFAVSAVGGAVLRLGQEPPDGAFVSIFALQLMLGGLAVIGYLLAAMVTEQKRAGEALRLAAKVYDTTSEGIFVTTPDGKILSVNDAFSRITGYARGEVLGQDQSFMKSDRHPPEFFASLWNTVLTTGKWQGEVWDRRSDGSLLPKWLSLSSVKDDAGSITECVGVFSDITELREAQAELLSTARRAGMAEIATNVLHNVGNVLNSVNVSAGLISSRLRASKIQGLSRAVQLIDEHAADLGSFLSHDDKGKLLPDYLNKLCEALASEQQGIVEELGQLIRSIEHIKDIVATQQSYAGASCVVEPVQIRELVDDALRMNAGALTRHAVTVVTEFADVPVLPLDRHRILQILVNLISNAKQAMDAAPGRAHRMTLRVALAEGAAGRRLQICVEDEGEGIPADNLSCIFNHGFTTRQNGHGFGLHSSALAAREMGGTLSARSDGPGCGAVFTLDLPLEVEGVAP